MIRTTEPLAKHVWLKVGGPAEIAIPESKSEFVDILNECHSSGRKYRILGNGSNLLVADEGIDDLVIKSTEACTDITFEGRRVQVGSSVMVPQFITACLNHDVGGYEYLYSVPGTIGGAIYMNAGRGESHNQTIADYLVSVEIFDDGEIYELPIDELDFDHRYSTFQQHDDWVILSATFEMPEQPREEGRKRAKERMKKVGKRERSKPNAGSVFKSGAGLPLHEFPPGGLSVNDAYFVHRNRICHNGNATSADLEKLVTRAKWLNRLVNPFHPPEVEWEIWK